MEEPQKQKHEDLCKHLNRKSIHFQEEKLGRSKDNHEQVRWANKTSRVTMFKIDLLAQL